MTFKRSIGRLVGALALVAAIAPGTAMAWADWHEGLIDVVFGCCYKQYSNQVDQDSGFSRSDNDSKAETDLTTLTAQYSNGWKYGGTFLYVDMLIDDNQSDVSFFSQGFEFISSHKVFKIDYETPTHGILKDVQAAVGWQLGNVHDYYAGTYANQTAQGAVGDPNIKVVYDAHDIIDVFYGIDFQFGVPGFQWVGLSIGQYNDQNTETDYEDQWTANLYYRINWYIGPTRWQADGFMQWYDERNSAHSGPLTTSYLYSQHQIKLDAGLLLFGRPNTMMVGTEIQWTQNSFGVADLRDTTGFAPKGQAVAVSTDEFFPTFMVEWVF